MIFESIFVFDYFEGDNAAVYHKYGSVLDLEATSSHKHNIRNPDGHKDVLQKQLSSWLSMSSKLNCQSTEDGMAS